MNNASPPRPVDALLKFGLTNNTDSLAIVACSLHPIKIRNSNLFLKTVEFIHIHKNVKLKKHRNDKNMRAYKYSLASF